MNENHSPDSTDVVTSVVNAFDAMRVPPIPGRQETLDAISRPAESAGNDAVVRRGSRLSRLTIGQRFAVGGIGLSTVAALVLLALVLSGNEQLSAMERMARQLNEVKSYSYDFRSETVTTDANEPMQKTTWLENGKAFWQAPDAFRSRDKIVKLESGQAGRAASEELLVEFVEAFRPGGQGVFINYKAKTYFPSTFDPTGSKTYPMEPLKRIREDAPARARDLGTRQIGGKTARGYVVSLATGDPPRRHDWHVWVDPETDLPLEIGYDVDDHNQPRTTTTLRLSNFRWNVQLDPKLFEPAPPEGFREVSPPAE
jgi:outer membrane lipoprotein-sorting protein